MCGEGASAIRVWLWDSKHVTGGCDPDITRTLSACSGLALCVRRGMSTEAPGLGWPGVARRRRLPGFQGRGGCPAITAISPTCSFLHTTTMAKGEDLSPMLPAKKKRPDADALSLDVGQKPIQLQRRRVWRACESCRYVRHRLPSTLSPNTLPAPVAKRSSAMDASQPAPSAPRPALNAPGSRPRIELHSVASRPFPAHPCPSALLTILVPVMYKSSRLACFIWSLCSPRSPLSLNS
jgi:hypothetical protein